MTWMGVVTYGAVVVPILPEFHQDDIFHIIAHSDSQLLFVGKEHERVLSLEALPEVRGAFGIKNLMAIAELSRTELAKCTDVASLFSAKYPMASPGRM